MATATQIQEAIKNLPKSEYPQPRAPEGENRFNLDARGASVVTKYDEDAHALPHPIRSSSRFPPAARMPKRL